MPQIDRVKCPAVVALSAALMLVAAPLALLRPFCLPAAAQTETGEPNPAPQPQPPSGQPTQAPTPPRANTAPTQAEPTKSEVSATVLDDKEVDSILGKDIRSSTGESMGRIVDVLVSRSGQVRAAIIDFGGFLGVGTRKIAVDWRAIQFPPDGKLDRITLALSRNELRLAPEYKKGEPIVMLGLPPSVTPPASTNASVPPPQAPSQ